MRSNTYKVSSRHGEKEVIALAVWSLWVLVFLYVISWVVLDPDASAGNILSVWSVFSIYAGILVLSYSIGVMWGFHTNYGIVLDVYTRYRREGHLVTATETECPWAVTEQQRVRWKYEYYDATKERLYEVHKFFMHVIPEEVPLIQRQTQTQPSGQRRDIKNNNNNNNNDTFAQATIPLLVVDGFPKSGMLVSDIDAGCHNFRRAKQYLQILLAVVAVSLIAFWTWLLVILPEVERRRYFVVPWMFVGILLFVASYRRTCTWFLHPQRFMLIPSWGASARRVHDPERIAYHAQKHNTSSLVESLRQRHSQVRHRGRGSGIGVGGNEGLLQSRNMPDILRERYSDVNSVRTDGVPRDRGSGNDRYSDVNGVRTDGVPRDRGSGNDGLRSWDELLERYSDDNGVRTDGVPHNPGAALLHSRFSSSSPSPTNTTTTTTKSHLLQESSLPDMI